MKFLSQHPINNKRVLLRVDYNVSLTPSHTIADDERIRQSLPTIKDLLSRNNKLIIVSHLGRPKGKDKTLSLQPVQKKLQDYLPAYRVLLVRDFRREKDLFTSQTPREIILLENIRFFDEEKNNDRQFAKDLASVADVYINDAFSVNHRETASVVGVTNFLPSLGGFGLEEELAYLTKALSHPDRPFVSIIGGGKISTKLILLEKLLTKTDVLLLGGGIANTMLKAQGYEIGKSICEDNLLPDAKKLLIKFSSHIVLPTDVIITNMDGHISCVQLDHIAPTDTIKDIGDETITRFSQIIGTAKTILWNGPLGYFEQKPFDSGTQKIYEAVIQNTQATSVVGGGDTIAALSHNKDFHQKISHISTGGGAMLTFLQNGSLPGIEALEKNEKALAL